MKARLVAISVSLLMVFGGIIGGVATAPSATAGEEQIAGTYMVYNGQFVGKLVVKSDGYSLAAYFFHMGPSLYRPVFTAVSICYTTYPGGVCKPTYGWDGGNFGGWAGPSIANPSGYHDPETGMLRSWRAGATLDWYGVTRYIQIQGHDDPYNWGHWMITG